MVNYLSKTIRSICPKVDPRPPKIKVYNFGNSENQEKLFSEKNNTPN